MMFHSTARNLKVSVLHSDPVLSLGLYTALRESAGMDVELPTCGDGSGARLT